MPRGLNGDGGGFADAGFVVDDEDSHRARALSDKSRRGSPANHNRAPCGDLTPRKSRGGVALRRPRQVQLQ
jgi:hypothetical protein